jgi:hypothetical protein
MTRNINSAMRWMMFFITLFLCLIVGAVAPVRLCVKLGEDVPVVIDVKIVVVVIPD